MLARSGRDHPREPVRFAVGKPDHPSNVAHRAFRIHLIERDDLRNAALAVFLPDVFEHFAAPVLAEIDVDIGRRDAFRIQKSIEEQSEVERINVGYSQDVRHERTRG